PTVTTDPVDLLLRGDPATPFVGGVPGITALKPPEAPTPAAGGDNNAAGGCTTWGQTYCQPSSGGHCGSDKHCHCCWATIGSGTGQATCNACSAACTSRGYLCDTGSNTCLDVGDVPDGPACQSPQRPSIA